MKKILTHIQKVIDVARKECIDNAEIRPYENYGYNSGEEMLDRFDSDDDEYHTGFDQGYLRGMEEIKNDIEYFMKQ